MSFETNKFSVVKKKRLESGDFNVECNVDTGVEIEKILSVCHSAQAENAEILNGVVNYSGSIDLCIIYLTVDGEVGTINASCPFASKFEDENIAVGDKVGIDVQVEDYSVESVTSANIKLNLLCQQSGVLILCREVGTVKCDDEEVCVKHDEVLVNTLVGTAQDTFLVESAVSLKEPVKKIISADSQAYIKSTESGVNFVSVAGEVVTKLLYLGENDKFETAYTTESFKQEIELEGVSREAISEAQVFVKKNAVRCEIDSQEKGVDIKIQTPLLIKVTSYIEKGEDVVSDIYSTTCELQVTTSSFDMTKQFAVECFEEKIDGNLTLDDDKPRVDKIMFVGGSNVAVTNSYVKGGEVFVEGVTKTNVVYLNDETNSLLSVVVEVPFVVSDKVDAPDESTVTAMATLVDVDVAVKKGREFLFDGKVKVCAYIFCDEVGAVISNVESVGDLAERDCAIEVIFADAGQTAWDIAKKFNVKEENVVYQNPELSFPLTKEENIVMFYKK